MKYQFIKSNSGEFSVDEMCHVFGLGRSGYHAWKNRLPSVRATEDESHKKRIREIYKEAKGRYGHRPIYHHLLDEGISCGRDRTLRLLKDLELQGIQSTRFKPMGTESGQLFGYSPNLLKQLGSPSGLDEIWVADTTYLRTKNKWYYLATVMDLYSRRIIGWALSARNDAKLVCEALRDGIFKRQGRIPEGLIHHSDRGSTYACDSYQRLLSRYRMKPSMSAKGNCYDNASMESFYGRYKTSSVRDYVFENECELRANVFEYIEMFYNRFRKHSSLGYKNPIQFEEKFLPPRGGKTASLSACPINN